MKKQIVLTGGGTAGHVTPNLALIQALEKQGWHIDYIGSEAGIERQMISREGIPYHAISTGKLNRYWTWKNFLSPIQVLLGMFQACRLMHRLRPRLVFSKGGFVAFPVTFAAWLWGIPVIAHESDLTPGLANRLCFPFVTRLCVTFEGTKAAFKQKHKVILTGTPIRTALFEGERKRGLAFCGFDGKKPVLLIVGGGLGAKRINEAVREGLEKLAQTFHIIHLCGKGKLAPGLKQISDYFQLEYAYDEMADLMAASDLIISRAGANSLYELLALHKPHLLIPLSKAASRGDQIDNARYFEQKGVSVVLDEAELSADRLCEVIDELLERLPELREKLKALGVKSGTAAVMGVIQGLSDSR